jgi:hypothetical protein
VIGAVSADQSDRSRHTDYRADQQEVWECRSMGVLAVEGMMNGKNFRTAVEPGVRVGSVAPGSRDEMEGYVACTAPAAVEQDAGFDAD